MEKNEERWKNCHCSVADGNMLREAVKDYPPMKSKHQGGAAVSLRTGDHTS